MHRRLPGLLFVVALQLLLAAGAHAERAQGGCGPGLSVQADGFALNPTLRAVTLAKATPNSPAAVQGLAAGDEILEFDGAANAGHKARDVRAIMRKTMAESIRLRLQRPHGEIHSIARVAVPKPSGSC